MFAKERKREILKLLQAQGKVKTLELSELLSVSEPTIRRDIAELDRKGLLIRTHGGALPVYEADVEPTFMDKVDRFAKEKMNIGKTAAKLIKDGKTVVMDGGTTTLQVAKHITAKDVVVITNSLDIAEVLKDKSSIEVILTGGSMRWHTRAMVGPIAEATLKKFRVDMAFIGINAIDIINGVTTHNLNEATAKRTMIDIAKRAFVVADHSKFNLTELTQVAELKDITGIITDIDVSPSIIEKYEKADIELIVKEGDLIDFDNHPKSGD